MKLTRTIAGIAFTLAMASLSFAQQGTSGWTLASVKGTYTFTEQGEIGSSTPFAGIGMLTLDGSGNVSGMETVQSASGSMDVRITGTYSVNVDGSGSLTLTNTTNTTDEDGNSATQTFTTKYKFFPASKNAELKAVRLDSGTYIVSNFSQQ
jgi:hypothetical protein